MRKAKILGFVLLILLVCNIAFAGDILSSKGSIDFYYENNTVAQEDFIIDDNLIAVDSSKYTFSKFHDVEYLNVSECVAYEKVDNVTSGKKEDGDCLEYQNNSVKIKDKYELAVISFKNCEENAWYRVYKHPDFTNDKEKIKSEGEVYGDYLCSAGEILFEIDSFSSYTTEQVDAIKANLLTVLTFDNVAGSTVIDEYNYANGTKVGSNNNFTTGFVGNAYSNDGTSGNYIQLPEKFYTPFNTAGAYTYAMWVKPNDAGAVNMYLLDLYGEMSDRSSLQDTNNAYAWQTAEGTVFSNNSLSYGSWVFLTFTFSTTNGVKIYENATLSNSDATKDTITTQAGADHNALGSARDTSHTSAIDGLIDEVMIWDRELNATEIAAVFDINTQGFSLTEYSSVQPNTAINQSSYEVTNAYSNPTTWQTNISNIVFTQTAFPIVNFTLNQTANCSISTSNLNYTAMIADEATTACSTTDSATQSCELPTLKPLSWDTPDYVYISCTGEPSSTTSLSGALAIQRVPEVSGLALYEGNILNLTEDGTNYGTVSEGWISQESKAKSLEVRDCNENQFLFVEVTELDASLNLYHDGSLIGNVPANAAGTGDWKTYAFNISSSQLTCSGDTATITVTAGTNTEATYINYMALADMSGLDDNYVPGNRLVALFGNITNLSKVDTVQGLIYNGTSGSVYKTLSRGSTFNTLSDTSYGNIAFAYITDQLDFLINQSFKSNFTGTSEFIESENFQYTIDNTAPTIDVIEADLNSLAGLSYPITVNITESFPETVNLTDSRSFFGSGLTLLTSDNISFSNNLSYPSTAANYTTVTIFAKDLAENEVSFDLNISVSKGVVTYSSLTYFPTFDYNISFYEIADASSSKNLPFYVNFTIQGLGDAVIDDKIIYYNISDVSSSVARLNVTYENGSIITFANQSTVLNWTTDSWDNSNDTDLNFNNILRYTINNALTLEYENSGVNNIRLFYAKLQNKNTSLSNISVKVPLRTTYSGNSSSIDVFVCTSGINWAAKTCGQYEEITATLFTQDDYTYHFGTNSSQYPTVDSNGDGNKDVLYFKIPSISANGEVMYKIDLDSSNAEVSWAATAPETPSGGGGGGGGGGGSSSSDDVVITSSTGSTTVQSSGFIGSLTSGFKKVGSGIVGFFGGILAEGLGLFKGVSSEDSFLIMIAMIVLILAFIFLSGEDKKKQSNQGFKV